MRAANGEPNKPSPPKDPRFRRESATGRGRPYHGGMWLSGWEHCSSYSIRGTKCASSEEDITRSPGVHAHTMKPMHSLSRIRSIRGGRPALARSLRPHNVG